MTKQIIYPSIFLRIIAILLDSLIVSNTLGYLSRYFFQQLMQLQYFKAFAVYNQQSIVGDMQDIDIESTFILIILIIIFQLMIFGIYCIVSWYHMNGRTIGKYLTNLQIVNMNTLTTPSLKQYITRFIGYVFFPISVITMFLTKNKLAIHDKMSKTVVIKI